MTSFLAQANRAKQQHEAEKAAYGNRGGGGNRIGSLYFKQGDKASVRIIPFDSEVNDDGQLIKMGNPARIRVTKIWKKQRVENSYLNPETFENYNPLEEARTAWMKAQFEKHGKDHKIDWRTCPLPSTSTRFLVAGLVCAYEPGPNSKDIDVDKRLGVKVWEIGEDVMNGLLSFVQKVALRCEADGRALQVEEVCCPKCQFKLIDEEDIKAIPDEEFIISADEGLSRLLGGGKHTCPNCGYDLDGPVVVKKRCGHCHELRGGFNVENANIIIERTGDKSYAFEIDYDRVGDLSALDPEMQAKLLTEDYKPITLELTYDPVTKKTGSNMWQMKGATEQVWAKLGGLGTPAATPTAPRAPLATLRKN